MAVTNLNMGLDMVDSAVLTFGGVTFRCLVWRDAFLQRVIVKTFAEAEDSGFGLTPPAVVYTALNPNQIDMPRVLAVGQQFVLHWIDTSFDLVGLPIASELFRALLDVADFGTGWVNQGSVALTTENMYDHTIVYGSSPEEFIVSRRTAPDAITTARYTAPYSWVDTVWTQTDAGLTIEDTVLACAAAEATDRVVVSYQDALTLQAYARMATDGTGLIGPTEVFDDLVAGDNQHSAVGIIQCDTVDDRIPFLIITEFIDDTNYSAGAYQARARAVGWRVWDARTSAALNDSHWAYGVTLNSKPWCWATGVTAETDVYVMLGFQSLRDGAEFEQSYGYVARLDTNSAATASGPGTVRPIVSSAILTGDIDAQPHGSSPVVPDLSVGRRLNHLPAPSGPGRSTPTGVEGYTLGPWIKSEFVAFRRWTRLILTSDTNQPELLPVQPAVGYIRFFHEPAWMARRWELEPTQPDTPQWNGSAPAPMSNPVPTPAGLLFTGGVTVAYDGDHPVELGYLWNPELLEVSPTNGGSMDIEGLYLFTYTFSWTDDLGHLHRSAPATPVGTIIAVGQFATLQVRTMTLSMKDDRNRHPTTSSISIEIWRTTRTAGGSEADSVGNLLFRREYAEDGTSFTIQDTPANDASDFRQEIPAGRPNSIVQNAELLAFQLSPTTLQWTPEPPIPHQSLRAATVWQNRVIGPDAADPRILRFSNEILPLGTREVWPEFTDTNTVRLDGRGLITAIQAMDYVCALFTRNSVHTLDGRPGDLQFDIRDVVTGVGCVNPRSVVHTQEGVYFQSEKGIYLMSRGFDVQYIGGPVEQFVQDAGIIRGAVHLEEFNQVRWVLNEVPADGPLAILPRVLTYDYSVGLWSITETVGFGQAAPSSRLNEMQHAATWRGRQGTQQLVFLQQGGVALERSIHDTEFSDEGAAGTVSVGLDITTEWYTLQDLAGLYRVREIGIETQRINDGGMTVDIYYDTEGTFDDNTIGDTFTWPSPAPAYLPIRPRIQKIRGFRLRIRELDPPPTENLRINKLMVRWQAKRQPGIYPRANIGT